MQAYELDMLEDMLHYYLDQCEENQNQVLGTAALDFVLLVFFEREKAAPLAQQAGIFDAKYQTISALANGFMHEHHFIKLFDNIQHVVKLSPRENAGLVMHCIDLIELWDRCSDKTGKSIFAVFKLLQEMQNTFRHGACEDAVLTMHREPLEALIQQNMLVNVAVFSKFACHSFHRLFCRLYRNIFSKEGA